MLDAPRHPKLLLDALAHTDFSLEGWLHHV
jgi:hypothetical protein